MKTTKTLYIVDDDPDDIFLLQHAVSESKLDINVHCAGNGHELLNILDKNVQRGLLLVDMNMPVMNGMETLQAIYADPDFRHFRSILISTSDKENMKKIALDSGAMKFICKPSHFDEYLQLICDIYHKCF